MALLGEKCGRCGRRTRHSYKGAPTCERCELDLEVKLKADAEAPRSCPVDGEKMAKEVIYAIVIDRCPTCHGVWLDGGELDHVKKGIVISAANPFVHSLVYPL